MFFWEIGKKLNNSNPVVTKTFEELPVRLDNPGRGWYRIVYFLADQDPTEKLHEYNYYRTERLELAVINIGAYKEGELPQKALTNIRQILDNYRQQDIDLILRVVYDHEGKAMEKEPFFFATVRRQTEQIAELVKEYAEGIFLYQGLMIGNWGEMHTSRFLQEANLRLLADCFYGIVGTSVYTAVRTPKLWRLLVPEKAFSEGDYLNTLGLFDDGIFGSMNHLGTFGTEKRESVGWEKAWSGEEELDFIENTARKVPFGGEVIFPKDREEVSVCEAVEQFRKMGVTYLNQNYDTRLLEHWEKQKWTQKDAWFGHSGLEYLGAHLGYRFWLKEANARGDAHSGVVKICVKLENLGFAGVYQKVDVFLEWETADHCRKHKCILEDLRAFNGQTEMQAETEIGEFENLSLFLEQRDGKRIFLANASDEKGSVLLWKKEEIFKKS